MRDDAGTRARAFPDGSGPLVPAVLVPASRDRRLPVIPNTFKGYREYRPRVLWKPENPNDRPTTLCRSTFHAQTRQADRASCYLDLYNSPARTYFGDYWREAVEKSRQGPAEREELKKRVWEMTSVMGTGQLAYFLGRLVRMGGLDPHLGFEMIQCNAVEHMEAIRLAQNYYELEYDPCELPALRQSVADLTDRLAGEEHAAASWEHRYKAASMRAFEADCRYRRAMSLCEQKEEQRKRLESANEELEDALEDAKEEQKESERVIQSLRQSLYEHEGAY